MLPLLLALALQSTPAAPNGDSIAITFDVRIPMRDGVTLSADIYRPADAGRHPVVLMRTPYNKIGAAVLKEARAFAERGYVYVAVDVRGRGDSGGEWRPYFHEGDDGYDAIEWCATQSWSTGKIGTIGRSYVGYNQWVAAVRRPPHLAAIIALAPMADPFEDVWITGPGGVPTPTMISWYHLTAGKVMQNMSAVNWDRLNWHVPLLTMDEAAGRPNERWRDIITHTTRDAWWDPLRYQDRFERVDVPALHISGWYDDTQRATPMNYVGMRTRAATPEARDRQKLVLGPWPHAINSTSKLGRLDFGSTAVIDLFGLEIDWFDRWLEGKPATPEKRVHLFAMQTNRWFQADDWPVPGTRFVKHYLRTNGALTTEQPGAERADTYRYDPASPTPFLTEPSFAQLGGPDDYTEVEQRKDLLLYTTPSFAQSTLMCGPLTARLFAASSATDTDFMVKVLDVWPNGYVQRLNDGMVRARFRNGFDKPELIVPGKVYAYDIDVWNTCQTVLPGHRIRVEVASSAFPKFDRNPNTGDPIGTSARMQVADQTVYHDRERASYVVLPFVPLDRVASENDLQKTFTSKR
jgi:putative CocE/NonD family hydrolase